MTEISEKLLLCKNTLIEMLTDREYIIDTRLLENSAELKMLVHHKKTNAQLLVHYCDEAKVGIKTLKMLIESFEKQDISHILLICKEALSPASSRLIEEYNSKFTIEVFKERELLFNVTKHELVPKHILLSENEKEIFLKNRKLKEQELPKILKSDPVARYYGAKRGQVFEILRKSESAGTALYYRVVI
ncbi:subunit Rpb5 of DNA-directed RNA polymerase [Hamiltosporidium tvaerminnensis]|uniref:Subunit Rpb5 of DNA-directed RNA polymerase n=2 Tax=Hamiltosporidium TaxID=1176354 RepID=A0A4Q9L765_9MICR|nr:subunit Rpb5 of DNA-directed RNA polymerase [Hamiltosporidium tvaerminnensis]TBU03487.1 subunit Rpb5 of DNA-directed RNA polymerase [Hamiltosporidium magnivora]